MANVGNLWQMSQLFENVGNFSQMLATYGKCRQLFANVGNFWKMLGMKVLKGERVKV